MTNHSELIISSSPLTGNRPYAVFMWTFSLTHAASPLWLPARVCVLRSRLYLEVDQALQLLWPSPFCCTRRHFLKKIYKQKELAWMSLVCEWCKKAVFVMSWVSACWDMALRACRQSDECVYVWLLLVAQGACLTGRAAQTGGIYVVVFNWSHEISETGVYPLFLHLTFGYYFIYHMLSVIGTVWYWLYKLS